MCSWPHHETFSKRFLSSKLFQLRILSVPFNVLYSSLTIYLGDSKPDPISVDNFHPFDLVEKFVESEWPDLVSIFRSLMAVTFGSILFFLFDVLLMCLLIDCWVTLRVRVICFFVGVFALLVHLSNFLRSFFVSFLRPGLFGALFSWIFFGLSCRFLMFRMRDLLIVIFSVFNFFTISLSLYPSGKSWRMHPSMTGSTHGLTIVSIR